jgi:hypothetical protein
VATGSGSVDTSGLTFFGPVGSVTNPLIVPQATVFSFGSGAVPLYLYPDQDSTAWGAGPGAAATSVSADTTIGIIGVGNFIFLPTGYVSGSSLGTNVATFANQTFASIGLNPGSYVYRLGDSAMSDTFTVNIGSPIPEPTADRKRWASGQASDWAHESYAKAKAITYTINSPAGCAKGAAPITLSSSYQAKALKTAKLQLEKAGVRLAWVLNSAATRAGTSGS